MLASAPYGLKTVNGWILVLNAGRYGTDYNTRAFAAYVGLGALSAENCVYPRSGHHERPRHDSDHVLDMYAIHRPPGTCTHLPR
jgi:hypothetical protein